VLEEDEFRGFERVYLQVCRDAEKSRGAGTRN